MTQVEYVTPGRRALAAIRREWKLSFGALIVAVILSLFIAPIYIPIFDIILAIVLMVIGSNPNVTQGQPCGRLIKTTALAIMITALISFLINISYHTQFVHKFYHASSLNTSIPFITSLIIFPVMAILSLVTSTRYVSSRHAEDCHLRNEYNPDQPLFGSIIHSVYRRILRFMGNVTLAISAIDWCYYALCYSNENLNSPDRFFFFFVPTAIFVGSIFYVRARFGMVVLRTGKDAFQAALGIKRPQNSTLVRFLVIRDNKLLLDASPTTIQDMNIDTPVIDVMPLCDELTMEEASDVFKKFSRLKDFKIKFLYLSEQSELNNIVLHYLVLLPDDEGNGKLDGTWTTLDWIDRYMKMGVLSSSLGAEIHRFYTISMAWKTYTHDGRRRYPIRNYRPSFRLADAMSWNVDYSDMDWLRIAHRNEDSKLWPLYKIIDRFNKKPAEA